MNEGVPSSPKDSIQAEPLLGRETPEGEEATFLGGKEQSCLKSPQRLAHSGFSIKACGPNERLNKPH